MATSLLAAQKSPKTEQLQHAIVAPFNLNLSVGVVKSLDLLLGANC